MSQYTAKLSWKDVAIIRLRAYHGDGPAYIAEDYPVHVSTIWHIVRGDSWCRQ